MRSASFIGGVLLLLCLEKSAAVTCGMWLITSGLLLLPLSDRWRFNDNSSDCLRSRCIASTRRNNWFTVRPVCSVPSKKTQTNYITIWLTDYFEFFFIYFQNTIKMKCALKRYSRFEWLICGGGETPCEKRASSTNLSVKFGWWLIGVRTPALPRLWICASCSKK